MEDSAERAAARRAVRGVARLWWLWIVFGVFWIAVAVVILQFDQASITTVGVLIGIMLLATAAESFVAMGLADRGMWLYGIAGFLLAVAGVIALVSPENTFAALADILGFVFLFIGVYWVIQAFIAREVNELWWLGLLAGILMIVLAFWTGGQFFVERAYVLLVFAGIWALMQGFTDIVRAFQIKKLDQVV